MDVESDGCRGQYAEVATPKGKEGRSEQCNDKYLGVAIRHAFPPKSRDGVEPTIFPQRVHR